MNNAYFGHDSQCYGVEEHRLVGGKGDGMRLLEVRNGAGLEFTVSLDRAADIARLTYGGINFGYFSPCGYVAPTFYTRDNFLNCFTAGFLTTCGLCNIGGPAVDEGEQLYQHGTVANIPAEQVNYFVENGEIRIKTKVCDEVIFGRKLTLEREYIVPLFGNTLEITDTITNVGSIDAPLQMLYHFNVGYPLLTEDTELNINSAEIHGLTEYAQADIANCLKMEKPQRGCDERCYSHKFTEKTANVSVYNPKINKGFVMSFDTEKLPGFCQWKLMGERDYVLGVEPACASVGDTRAEARAKGLVQYLKPGDSKVQSIKFEFKGE